eukprot:TRINITY_DN10010_c0_g1_i1.p1 TRINITY_DN10010_c0_g1~~TRINITY_DN10010_c0_g1_i1.p1  ORF type:complete len:208 (+),score=24.41 TRINITY_DN10010_c0_g1_i1:106-729(+)
MFSHKLTHMTNIIALLLVLITVSYAGNQQLVPGDPMYLYASFGGGFGTGGFGSDYGSGGYAQQQEATANLQEGVCQALVCAEWLNEDAYALRSTGNAAYKSSDLGYQNVGDYGDSFSTGPFTSNVAFGSGVQQTAQAGANAAGGAINTANTQERLANTGKRCYRYQCYHQYFNNGGFNYGPYYYLTAGGLHAGAQQVNTHYPGVPYF